MTQISNADVNMNTRISTEDYEGPAKTVTTADSEAVPYFWANGNKLNDNTNGLFDIVAIASASTTWIIGADKVASKMEFKLAKAATWSNDRAVAAVCGPTAGATIPTDLVLTSGVSGTGAACTAAFKWIPGAEDATEVGNYDATWRVQRYCRFCDASLATDKIQLHLKEYVPPTTTDRLLTRMTVWASDTDGKALLTIDAGKTNTKQNPVNLASGACGKSGQTTKKETLGQSVEFSIKSTIDLAAEQAVIWEHATLAFALAADLPANSVSCTCPGKGAWDTRLVKSNSDKRLQLTLPTKASGATTDVICTKGDLVCTARVW